jgi:hypothetical protein
MKSRLFVLAAITLFALTLGACSPAVSRPIVPASAPQLEIVEFYSPM